jgi:hypothetical protein
VGVGKKIPCLSQFSYIRTVKRIDTQHIRDLVAEMIQSITHKGLRLFFEKGNGSKLPAEYLAKIALILDALDALASENDIKALGGGIHLLTGN